MAKTFDGPPSIERSGSEHREGAVTSLALLERARAWEWVKDPPAGEGQVGQKNTSLAKEEQAVSKNARMNFQLTFRKERNAKARLLEKEASPR